MGDQALIPHRSTEFLDECYILWLLYFTTLKRMRICFLFEGSEFNKGQLPWWSSGMILIRTARVQSSIPLLRKDEAQIPLVLD